MPSSNRVTLSYPYVNPIFTDGELKGSRTIILDWGPSIAVVGDALNWKFKQGDKEIWWDTTVTLENLTNAAGARMPTRVVALKRTSALGDSKCVAETTEISKISLGSVKREDLNITFTAGTYVTDAVRKVSYTVGDDGKPKGEPQKFTETKQLAAEPVVSAALIKKILLALNIVLIVCVAAALLVRWRRTKAA
jgi:hypothetical protein